MSRASTLILLGILVVLTPYSGLPVAIRSFLALIFGACVIGIGIAMRAEQAKALAASYAEQKEAPAEPVATLAPPAGPSAI